MLKKAAILASGLMMSAAISAAAHAGAITANGWYEGEEIYYILGGEENVSSRGANQLYVIGNDQGFLDNAVGILPANKKPYDKLIGKAPQLIG